MFPGYMFPGRQSPRSKPGQPEQLGRLPDLPPSLLAGRAAHTALSASFPRSALEIPPPCAPTQVSLFGAAHQPWAKLWAWRRSYCASSSRVRNRAMDRGVGVACLCVS